MTNFEKIKNMSKDELADFLLKCEQSYPTVYDAWFTDVYCSKCEIAHKNGHACSFCEVNKYCKFFKEESEHYANPKNTLLKWLDVEAQE